MQGWLTSFQRIISSRLLLAATAHPFVSNRPNGLRGEEWRTVLRRWDQQAADYTECGAAPMTRRGQSLTPCKLDAQSWPLSCVTSTATPTLSAINGLETFPAHLQFAPDAAICGTAELFLFRQWSGSNLFLHLNLYRSRAEMGHFHLAFHSLGTILGNLAIETRSFDSSSPGQFILLTSLNLKSLHCKIIIIIPYLKSCVHSMKTIMAECQAQCWFTVYWQ